jgi:hypothetical protein
MKRVVWRAWCSSQHCACCTAVCQIVEHLNHLRAHHVNASLWKRVAEVVLLTVRPPSHTVSAAGQSSSQLASLLTSGSVDLYVHQVVTGAVTVYLPGLFKCEHPSRELMMRDSIGCLCAPTALLAAERDATSLLCAAALTVWRTPIADRLKMHIKSRTGLLIMAPSQPC